VADLISFSDSDTAASLFSIENVDRKLLFVDDVDDEVIDFCGKFNFGMAPSFIYFRVGSGRKKDRITN